MWEDWLFNITQWHFSVIQTSPAAQCEKQKSVTAPVSDSIILSSHYYIIMRSLQMLFGSRLFVISHSAREFPRVIKTSEPDKGILFGINDGNKRLHAQRCFLLDDYYVSLNFRPEAWAAKNSNSRWSTDPYFVYLTWAHLPIYVYIATCM